MKYKLTKDENEFNFDKFFDFPFFRVNKANQMMKSDIIENKDYYLIKIDVPGIEKKDIKIVTSNGYLEVYVTREEEKVNEDNYLHKERYKGEFVRKFYIGNVEKENVDATLKNGVLELTVQKSNKKEEDNYIEIK